MLRDLRVFQKAEEINLWLHVKINNFPRGERFTLGEGIKKNALKLLEDIIRANYEVEKTVTLGEAGVTLEILRILVRMAKKQECMNFKEYEYCADWIRRIFSAGTISVLAMGIQQNPIQIMPSAVKSVKKHLKMS